MHMKKTLTWALQMRGSHMFSEAGGVVSLAEAPGSIAT